MIWDTFFCVAPGNAKISASEAVFRFKESMMRINQTLNVVGTTQLTAIPDPMLFTRMNEMIDE
jgi:hypothetical protein